jgi:glycosyltransferase involved in cell wall biosynthesis
MPDLTTSPTGPPTPRRTVVQLATAPFFFRWFLEGHVRALQSAGYRVHVLSAPGPDLDWFCEATGAARHAVPMERGPSPARDLVSLLGVVRALRAIRPDIVHAHTPKAGLLGMVAGRLLRLPVRVYHCHGLRYETASGPGRAVLWAAERLTCALADHVLTVGPSMRAALIGRRLCPARKVEVLHRGSAGGVDGERFAPPAPEERRSARERLGIPADARVMGYVGRVVRDKGIEELYLAWRLLAETLPDLHLVVVGPVEAGDPVPAEVLEAMSRAPRVHLVGLDWHPPPLFAAMDVVALPSRREGFGLAALEASAMGLPVVASRIPGCVDAVEDGVTGRLVPPGDAPALARALRGYLEDAALRAAHGAAGRARALADFRPAEVEAALRRRYHSWAG